MKKSIQIIASFFLLSLILFIYKNWFLSREIIGGDWPYMYQEAVNTFSVLPPAWSTTHGNGLGGTFLVYALDSYLYFTGWFFSNLLHIPWPFVYKSFYFGMFLFGSVFSIWYLLKKLFSEVPQVYRFIGAFIYVANTYVLLIASGGQMGIALAYAVAPLVLATFIKVANSIKYQVLSIKYSVIAGILFAVQVMFDLRLAYITLLVVSLYLVLSIKYKVSIKNIPNTLYLILYTLIIPLGITALLHAFWILPLLLVGNSSIEQLGGIYTTAGAVKFFSFAKLENSLSLLHPNWPENLFGKIYFMKAEFLLLPILAYSSLLFISEKRKAKSEKEELKSQKLEIQNDLAIQQFSNRTILFFALLGLLGAFLAKGANDPFGFVYIWLFEHVPGFVMFRDPTKWYLLVAISYSVLVPFSIYSIYQWLSKSKIFNFQTAFLLLVTCYLLLLIHPAWLGQLGGTFKHREVPGEYVALKDKLYNDPQFYRTLWVPRQQRFTFGSNSHPSMEAGPLFSATDAASLAKDLHDKKTEGYVSDLGVKYIIIPYDPYGDIFTDDRKYSQKKRDEYEKVLNKISWLKKIEDGKITIYETKEHKGHFWLEKGNGKVAYKMISSTQYEVSVQNAKKGDVLIFAENYSPYWKASIDSIKYKVLGIKYKKGLNSFVLPQGGSYKLNVYYSVEKYYTIGRVISAGALITIVLFLWIPHYHKGTNLLRSVAVGDDKRKVVRK